MRVIICGGRHYQMTPADHTWLDTLCITHVRHGAASGADYGAMCWARERGIPQQPYPAAWATFGRAAGPKRNGWMLADLLKDKEGEPIAVIAFPGGTGTADMVRRARAAGMPVLIP